MNFAGHVAVVLGHGRRSGPTSDAPDPDVLLGSVLPDLAAMGRFRLVEPPSRALLAAGVRVHHRTDDAFHQHPWFLAADGAVTERLTAIEVPRGASMACGHVGVELLLDGHLLRRDPALRPAVQTALATAGRRIDELVDLVRPDDRAAWRRHLQRVSAWPVPDDYHEPGAVAERLHRILSRRPRLALPASQIGLVATALAAQHATMLDGVDALLDDLVEDLGPSPLADPGPRPRPNDPG